MLTDLSNQHARTMLRTRTDHLTKVVQTLYLVYIPPNETGSVTNLFVTGARDCENARDRENARDQVAPTSHVTVGTHVTYHVTSGPLGYHVTYHVTHHVIQLA